LKINADSFREKKPDAINKIPTTQMFPKLEYDKNVVVIVKLQYFQHFYAIRLHFIGFSTSFTLAINRQMRNDFNDRTFVVASASDMTSIKSGGALNSVAVPDHPYGRGNPFRSRPPQAA